ncbi:unnamed protein product [Closterium sp. NIES-54]
MSTEDEVYAFVKGSDDAKRLLSGIKLAEDSGGVVLRSDADVSSAKDLVGFDVDRFFCALSTDGLGRTLLASKRISSTHSLVSKSFETLPIGTVCISRIQYSGRGRGGNMWESPEGCLMFSLSLRWIDGRTLPLLQSERGQRPSHHVHQHRCKPTPAPLCPLFLPPPFHSPIRPLFLPLPSHLFLHAPPGIGLNVDNAQPTTCINAALQAACPSAAPVSHEALLAALLNRLHSLLTVFQQQGGMGMSGG